MGKKIFFVIFCFVSGCLEHAGEDRRISFARYSVSYTAEESPQIDCGGQILAAAKRGSFVFFDNETCTVSFEEETKINFFISVSYDGENKDNEFFSLSASCEADSCVLSPQKTGKEHIFIETETILLTFLSEEPTF